MKLKNEKGSVTLFVLVSCLFFLTSVACVNMYISSKQSAVNKEYKQIKTHYEKDLSEETITSIYNNLKNRNNIVSFGKPQKSYKNKELFVPITLNGLSLDVKTIKYGWFYNQNNLNPETDSSLLTQISPWSYVEKGNVNLNLNVQAKTACANDGFYYLCFMLDDKPYWTNSIKSYAIRIQIGTTNTPIEITEDTDLDSIYGQEVINYAKSGDNSTYRIFYIDFDGKYGDSGTIYLKADYDGSRTMDLTSYASFNPTTTLVKEMNPDWAKTTNRGNIDSSDWNINEQAAAYLCTPTLSENGEMWSAYYDANKADFVIGSPSLEMYCDSYNQVTHIVGNNILGASYRSTDYPGYIYTLGNPPTQSSVSNNDYWTGYNTLDNSGYNYMYCPSGSDYWLLASPSSSYNDGICGTGGGAYLNRSGYNYTCGFCPLVSLKSNFVPITPQPSTVNFYVDGQVYSTNNTTVGGTLGALPADPTKANYTFQGWYDTSASTGGNQYTANSTINSATLNLYARFEPAVEFAITYPIDGEWYRNDQSIQCTTSYPSNANITWSVQTDENGSINQNGVYIPVSGTADGVTITATCNGQSDTITINTATLSYIDDIPYWFGYNGLVVTIDYPEIDEDMGYLTRNGKQVYKEDGTEVKVFTTPDSPEEHWTTEDF